jgi:threonine/homoserine/homoserine lactone efflux protein
MIISLIAGILTGFIVSIPPLGPIAFALISKGFKNETKDGMAIAAGSAFMDMVYCLVALGGISLIISLLPESVEKFYFYNTYTIQIVLTYVGCFLVIIYGIRIMRSKTDYGEMKSAQASKLDVSKKKITDFEEKHTLPIKPSQSNLFGMFMMGVLLCLSSITLPASWIAVVSYLKSYKLIESTFLAGLLFSVGAFAGTFLWFWTLLKLITGNKHRINVATVNKLNIIAGYILIGLGVFLFFKATQTLFFS